MAMPTTSFEAHRSWRALLSAFLPLASEPERPFPPGQRLPFQVQCRRGKHVWLKPEDSLRSARTGFTVTFCRYCMAHQRLVPARSTQPIRVVTLSERR
jgi:hypothetical protein